MCENRDVEALQRYAWPGNARELQNVMERAAILSTRGRLQLNLPGTAEVRRDTRPLPRSLAPSAPEEILTAQEIAELERRNIEFALLASQGRVSGAGGAAERLQMKPQTRPLNERGGEIGVEYGTFDFKQVKFDMTGPITSDGRWPYRLAGLARDADTQVNYTPPS